MEDSFSRSLSLVSTMTFVAEAVIFSRIAKKWGVGNSKKK
jgi:hypothetical protein